MSPDAVQALVARCLAEPSFLAASLAAEAEQAPGGEGLGAGDAAGVLGAERLERLGLFRGFITKIKHNALRRVVPLTLDLLACLRLEVDVFAACSAEYVILRAAGPLSPDRQLAFFEDQLARFLKTQPGAVREGVLALLAHEACAWRVGMETGPAAAAPGAVAPCGGLRVQGYGVDVLALADALATGSFDPAADWPRRACRLAYRRTPDGLAVAEIDGFSAFVLSLVDGRRDVAAITEAVAAAGLPQVSEADVGALLAQAGGLGLVVMPAPQGEGRPCVSC